MALATAATAVQPFGDPGSLTVPRMFREAAKRRAARTILRQKHHGIWKAETWRELETVSLTDCAGTGPVVQWAE